MMDKVQVVVVCRGFDFPRRQTKNSKREGGGGRRLQKDVAKTRNEDAYLFTQERNNPERLTGSPPPEMTRDIRVFVFRRTA
ncbi:hypothetical protein BJV74DRAFT_850560 [Russula compacta]|nr:hypothetical protein BJV74DRAFT_850560 [Russula compacta]